MEKLGQNLPPLKKIKLTKKQEEEDIIKRKLIEANKEWCDWRFRYTGINLRRLIQGVVMKE